jgi:tRNA-dihydrouridine synthase
LLVEVLKAMRKAVGPGFPIEVRISGSECYDGGFGIETGIAAAKAMDGYCDLIHVSAGSHEVEQVFTVTHPSMFLSDGCNVQYAAEIKKHVKTPVATVGALVEPELMEEILASGKADVVEVARGLMADPDIPLKARSGREDEIKKCMRCLACFSNLLTEGQFKCAINPEIGHEAEYRFELPRPIRKRCWWRAAASPGWRPPSRAQSAATASPSAKSPAGWAARSCASTTYPSRHACGSISNIRRSSWRSAAWRSVSTPPPLRLWPAS